MDFLSNHFQSPPYEELLSDAEASKESSSIQNCHIKAGGDCMVNVEVLMVATTSCSHPERDKWQHQLHGMWWNI